MPLIENSNEPVLKHWGKLTTTRLPEDGLREFFKGNNLAVIPGKLSNNLFVIDCFDALTFKRISDYLGSTMNWVVTTSQGHQIWLRCRDGEIYNHDGKGSRTIGHNNFVIVPPSRDSQGDTFYWEKRDGELPTLLSWYEFQEMIPGIRLRFSADRHSGFVETYSPTIWKRWNYRNKPDIAELFDWAEGHSWKGRTSSTDKMVFLNCCARAADESIEAFHASVREIAEMSGVTHKTAGKSLRRLTTSGLIKFIDSGPRGNRYGIMVDVHNYHSNVRVVSGVIVNGFSDHTPGTD
ncbi:MAG: hypothetical protein M1281_02735 [Chloroflexi bacterium]|nr:hypothetical protein [Chloroflexota bacterium]